MLKGGSGKVLLLFFITLAVLIGIRVLTVRGIDVTVTTTEDEVNADGDCSLREAITAVNTGAQVDACPAGDGVDDTIILDDQTYTLDLTGAGEDNNATGDLDILADVTIQGQGANATTIIGQGDRIFDIDAGVTATISGVTVTGGTTNAATGGAGIYSLGNLTLDGVAVDGNDATGPANAGGIFNDGNGILTIQNSTISNNTSADTAGAIQNENNATLEMINSTISGNTAPVNVGGINNQGTASLNNVTITNNTVTNGNGGGHIQPSGCISRVK